MPRVCEFTGRKTSAGRTYAHRGKPKYLGGVGTKVTGKSKRRFRANIQKFTALINGTPRRVKASAKAVRMGLVVKPPKRRAVYQPAQDPGEPGDPAASGAPEAGQDQQSEALPLDEGNLGTTH